MPSTWRSESQSTCSERLNDLGKFSFNLDFRSLQPITRLLAVKHTPCVIQWAVWVLCNILTLEGKVSKNCDFTNAQISEIN